eukprot:TRINITY_DN41228_c0_g1_i1.p2 TRINITY_DN41228_c0_g1~~TRINITY_DN41228_c0_g1_i1.p2  ORF type:complete len:143 (+),score=32.71 TRINITY_DN41228_c0_g1_i1:51-431(+)
MPRVRDPPAGQTPPDACCAGDHDDRTAATPDVTPPRHDDSVRRTRLRRPPVSPSGAKPSEAADEDDAPVGTDPGFSRTSCCLFGLAVGAVSGAAGGAWVGVTVAKAEMAQKLTSLLGPKLAGFFTM